MRTLSRSIQDYIKAIFELALEGAASTTDISHHLKVSPASVTNMLKKLDEMKLVRYESYKGVTLTHAGRKIALEIIRHHRLVELYLAEALGYRWDEVHDEAENLEHHISEDFEDRISKVLGDPQYDPHGSPIPTKDGRIPPTVHDRLSDANVEETVVIKRVSDDDKLMLRFLTKHDIGLDAQLQIVSREEPNGHVSVRHNGQLVRLDRRMADNIFVQR